MNAPVGEEELASYEAELFGSLRRDEPSAAARHAVGIGLGMGSVAVGGAAAAAGGAALPASSLKIGPLLFAKWLGLGMTAGVVSLGSVHYAAPSWSGRSASHVASTAAPTRPSPISAHVARRPSDLPQPASGSADPRAASRAADSPELADSREPQVSPEPNPGTRASAALAPPAGELALRDTRAVESVAGNAEPPPGPVLPSTLASEIALLDRAQSAVTAKQAPRALDILHQYARDFPDGVLRPEAEVLRIEGLFLQGSISEAFAAGRGFLHAHPTSTHASRVRQLLAEYQKR